MCAINALNAHYCYHKSQTYKVSEIEFFLMDLRKKFAMMRASVSVHQRNKTDNLEEKNRKLNMQKKMRKGVRDSPSDSLSSDGGRLRGANLATKKKPMQKRLLTMHRRMMSNMV